MKKTRVPVCQGLIKSQTIMGVSREVFILNATLCGMFLLALKQPILIVINFIIHFILRGVCKKDPLSIKIFFKRYSKQKDYLNEG
ncbi:MAG: VirB3 family type IV secretion system protein [Cetobacterium sp.]|uniref:VirB3 family type IV secretion system protein n=1 Tax=Cetobacterium sp. TaxID=2071632 RepID=UPI003F373C1D